ncbi:zinc-binding dehydrogenase [Xylaria palmicola]|nr:zinc-binding dehydrogenase [Xylaria palmicola]
MATPIRKVVISEFGDVSKIGVEQSSIEPPKPGEVQVAPIYAGFSGADINMRRGQYPMQRKAPLTPGYCLAGRARTDGARVRAGDLVACLTVYDAQAELVNLPEKYLIPVPDGVAPDTAAALALDWATALGMVERAAVARGQRVFVHGASGAVGYATATLCRLRGADVYGTASARNHAALRARGVTPFAYADKAWIGAMQGLGGAHAVFDALGAESWEESYSILPPCAGGGSDGPDERGLLVAYGQNQSALTGAEPAGGSVLPFARLLLKNAKIFSARRTCFYYITRDQPSFVPNLRRLFDMARDGTIDVVIKNVWDMEDIKTAHQNWASSSGVGSNLIRISSENSGVGAE